MTLEFNEISDDQQFEELVTSYFEEIKKEKQDDVVNIEVKPPGMGTDGGKDILVTFQVSDSVSTFSRKWVVQCKFHNSNISTDRIADVNIPTLLYSYGASGYLLICKNRPTSKLSELFERLEKECRLGNKYIIWSGEQFKRLLLVKESLLQQYFPKYFEYLMSKK
jgi:hypothetical protein